MRISDWSSDVCSSDLNPIVQSLANVDEIKELFQSADFNDPQKLGEALYQSKQLFQELYKEVMAIISDKQKLKQFINELLSEMDPSTRLMIEQILSFDMDGIANILETTDRKSTRLNSSN